MGVVASTRRAGGRRVKLLMILAIIAASALALLAWTQTWVLADLLIQGTATARIDVTGSTAAPALTALALAGLALAGALTIAGPVIRIVLGALESLLGVSVFLAALGAVIDPAGASAAAVTAATGIAGHESIHASVAGATLTGWPWLALAAAVLMVIAGIAVLATQHRWPGPTARYQAVRLAPASPDAGDTAVVNSADDSTARGSDSIGDWDELSRGEDPTA